jgi:hypothetical protein
MTDFRESFLETLPIKCYLKYPYQHEILLSYTDCLLEIKEHLISDCL